MREKLLSSTACVQTTAPVADSPENPQPPRAAIEPPMRAAWRVDDAAFRLSISRVSIYAMAKRGELRLIKIAGRTLIPECEIVRLTTPQTTTEAA